jgi:hypothetical protein
VHERKIYPLLQGGVGMPTLWASGLWGRWDYLAMDLLGSSLDRLFRKAGKNVMDLRSTCSIAIQLVRCFLAFLLFFPFSPTHPGGGGGGAETTLH